MSCLSELFWSDGDINVTIAVIAAELALSISKMYGVDEMSMLMRCYQILMVTNNKLAFSLILRNGKYKNISAKFDPNRKKWIVC